jgi:hypothetical protein
MRSHGTASVCQQLLRKEDKDLTVTANGVGEASSHEADGREEPHLDLIEQ